MKLWITSRSMLRNPNNYRIILSYTLRIKSRNSILFSYPYYTRSKLRMTNTKNSCKWSIYVLLIPISTYRTINLLWILLIKRNMKHWSSIIYPNNSNSIHRICTTMRTNKILRSNSYYQSILSYSILRHKTSRMNLRRICSR